MELYREGMARLNQGQVEEGRRLLEEALRSSPGSVEVMHGLALALDLEGKRGEAQALLERANAQAPHESGPACALALLYMEHERNTQAQSVLEPVLEAHPDDARAHLHMALAVAKIDPLRARAHAERALQVPEPELREQAEALLRALKSLVPA
jgi:Tfp pilus assembly protein PilF